MDWTFVYLMFFLKLPIVAMLWIVWWAVHNVDEDPPVDNSENDDDGGIGRLEHPRGPKPRPARRGPHPGQPPAPPARTRTTRPSRTPAGHDH
jgi:hypothetical protein